MKHLIATLLLAAVSLGAVAQDYRYRYIVAHYDYEAAHNTYDHHPDWLQARWSTSGSTFRQHGRSNWKNTSRHDLSLNIPQVAWFRAAAIRGAPILHQFTRYGENSTRTYSAEPHMAAAARAWLAAEGVTTVTVLDAEDWVQNPLYTEGERSLDGALRENPALDSFRTVSADKVIPDATHTSQSCTRTGEEQVCETVTRGIRIVFWPALHLLDPVTWEHGRVLHAIIDKRDRSIVFTATDSNLLARTAFTFRQGSIAGTFTGDTGSVLAFESFTAGTEVRVSFSVTPATAP